MDQRLHWTDLQFFLAVCEQGSIGAAAQSMAVNHSTVLRRLASLEAALAVRLFDRLPGGYVLTEHGQELSAGIAGVSEQVDAARRRVTGADLQVRGVIRLTAPDSLIRGVLLPHLAQFAARHPQLRLDLVATSTFLNLTQREADVAVRGCDKPPENLVGRRAGVVQTSLYASRSYLASLGADHSEADYRWVGHDDSIAHLTSAKWIRQHVAPERIALRVGNLVAMEDAIAAGFGVGWLLCPLGDACAGLVRLRPPPPELDTQLWVLTHPDLRRVARIRALTDFLYERLSGARTRAE